MEVFSLKWTDYQSNVSKSFQSLRNNEDFCDVTLVGDDFKQFTAHKVILSSCSEYFKNILKNNGKHSHPILCLQGLSFQDIQNILDYIYNGELNIYQEDIDRFLFVAQRLKLEGLIGQENPTNEAVYEETMAKSHLDDHFPVAEHSNEGNLKRTNSSQERTTASLSGVDIDTIENLNEKVEESYCQAPVQVHTIPYLKESQRISENL